MYFRIKKTPSGEVHQLIEAYRDSLGRSRGRTVISLGSAKIPNKSWKPIAKAVENKLYNIYYEADSLFELEYIHIEQTWIDKIIRYIDLKGGWKPNTKQNLKSAENASDIPEEKTETFYIPGAFIVSNVEYFSLK